MLEFFKGPFLVLHFSCCILMTFVMMLSVILLFMLMIPLSILTVIKGLVDFNARKTQLVLFDWSQNNGSLDVKMDVSVLEKKIIF